MFYIVTDPYQGPECFTVYEKPEVIKTSSDFLKTDCDFRLRDVLDATDAIWNRFISYGENVVRFDSGDLAHKDLFGKQHYTGVQIANRRKNTERILRLVVLKP